MWNYNIMHFLGGETVDVVNKIKNKARDIADGLREKRMVKRLEKWEREKREAEVLVEKIC